jgi:hypothetical protein
VRLRAFGQNGQSIVVVSQAAALTAVNFPELFGVRCALLRTKLVQRFLRKRPFLKDLLFVRFAEHLTATLARRWDVGSIGQEMDAYMVSQGR